MGDIRQVQVFVNRCFFSVYCFISRSVQRLENLGIGQEPVCVVYCNPSWIKSLRIRGMGDIWGCTQPGGIRLEIALADRTLFSFFSVFCLFVVLSKGNQTWPLWNCCFFVGPFLAFSLSQVLWGFGLKGDYDFKFGNGSALKKHRSGSDVERWDRYRHYDMVVSKEIKAVVFWCTDGLIGIRRIVGLVRFGVKCVINIRELLAVSKGWWEGVLNILRNSWVGKRESCNWVKIDKGNRYRCYFKGMGRRECNLFWSYKVSYIRDSLCWKELCWGLTDWKLKLDYEEAEMLRVCMKEATNGLKLI
ncbi:hypothetical protein Hanom_Chr04g00331651 [Helianthus anomalus]